MPTSIPVRRIFGRLAGALERDQDDLVDLRVPVLLGPASEEAAADQAGLVVCSPEVGRAGVRHFDSRSAECSPRGTWR